MIDLQLTPSQYLQGIKRLGLLENPYAPYGDDRYFFPTEEQVFVYKELLSSIEEKTLKNISIVIGEASIGKTSLAKRLFHAVAVTPELLTSGIYFDDPKNTATPAKLLKRIFLELNLPPEKNMEERIKALQQHLQKRMREKGSSILIVVDGDMLPETIDILFELANWFQEVDDGKGNLHKTSLVQIALFGRINASYFPLEKSAPNFIPITRFVRVLGIPKLSELMDLLEKQATHAGRDKDLFTREAKDLLVEASEMKPGELISLANQALLQTITSRNDVVDQKIVKQILPSKKKSQMVLPGVSLLY